MKEMAFRWREVLIIPRLRHKQARTQGGGFERVRVNSPFPVGMKKFLHSLYSQTRLSIRESRKYVGVVDCH